MKRRELIALLGGAAASPVRADAQPAERVRRVGIVTGFSEAEMQPLVTALKERLLAMGWTEGRNFVIDLRMSGGDLLKMVNDAEELVGERPEVIIAQGTPGLNAVRRFTQSTPIVFVLVADPVRLGLIESLARPGGNATGFTNFEYSIGAKWLELLREAAPTVKRATFLMNPRNPNGSEFAALLQAAGAAMAINVAVAQVRDRGEIEAAISKSSPTLDGGLVIQPDSLMTVHRNLIVSLAARYRIPAIYPFRIFAAAGGLMSYGLDFPELYRQAGTYVDRILRGEKPADLPVQAPSKFELVINLSTVRALGLNLPLTLQASADEVIE